MSHESFSFIKHTAAAFRSVPYSLTNDNGRTAAYRIGHRTFIFGFEYAGCRSSKLPSYWSGRNSRHGLHESWTKAPRT